MLSPPVTGAGQMDRLNAFMKSESLPYDLKLRLREYFRESWNQALHEQRKQLVLCM